jgi:hypothetical protein
MIANIAWDDALILPHCANPAGWNFRERQAPRPGVLYVEKRTGWGRPGCESLRAIAAGLESAAFLRLGAANGDFREFVDSA